MSLSSVWAATYSEGSPSPAWPHALTLTRALVPAGRSLIVHGLCAHSAGPAIHSLPPSIEYSVSYSIEYETEYCATGVLSCSMPQYSLPSKPMDGSLAPGLDQDTSSAFLFSSPPESTELTVTATGGLGTTLGVESTVRVAFCARLEKFMLRDDMYLNSPGLNLSMPRSTV